MSDMIFPQFAGLDISRTKTPEWKTIVHQSVNGKESRTQMMSSPIWNFTLQYNALRTTSNGNELAKMLSFYNQMGGSYHTFLYLDPDDNIVTNQVFAVADGTTTSYQLYRNIYSFLEPIQNVNGTPQIFADGTLLTSGYTISSTGVVTFTTAPSAGQSLSWTGSFYFRVRFTNDTQDYDQFMYNLYEMKTINLRSVKL